MIGTFIQRSPLTVVLAIIVLAAGAINIALSNVETRQTLTWIAEIRTPLLRLSHELDRDLDLERAETKKLLETLRNRTVDQSTSDAGLDEAGAVRNIWEKQTNRMDGIEGLLGRSEEEFPKKRTENRGLNERFSAVNQAYGSYQNLARDLVEIAKLGDLATLETLTDELSIEGDSVRASLSAFQTVLTNAQPQSAKTVIGLSSREITTIAVSTGGALAILAVLIWVPWRRSNKSYRTLLNELEDLEAKGAEHKRLNPQHAGEDPLIDTLHRIVANWQIRDRLLETFGRHLSDPMIEAVAANGGLGALETKVTKVTVISVEISHVGELTNDKDPDHLAQEISVIDDWMVELGNKAMALRQNRTATGGVFIFGEPFLTADQIEEAVGPFITHAMKDHSLLKQKLAKAAHVPIQSFETLGIHLGLTSGSALMGILGGAAGPRLRYHGDPINQAMKLSQMAVRQNVAIQCQGSGTLVDLIPGLAKSVTDLKIDSGGAYTAYSWDSEKT